MIDCTLKLWAKLNPSLMKPLLSNVYLSGESGNRHRWLLTVADSTIALEFTQAMVLLLDSVQCLVKLMKQTASPSKMGYI